jgi:hypothetical protein
MSPLPDLIAKLQQMREPRLGMAPDEANWTNRKDHIRSVCRAFAEWVEAEGMEINRNSREGEIAARIARERIFEYAIDELHPVIDDNISLQRELAVNPDAYTAWAAE